MERRSKELFDAIDVENFFKTWHRDVRTFRENLDQDCVLSIIKETKTSFFDISKHKEVLNFTNTPKCKDLLERVLKEKDTHNFLNILKERDSFHPRRVEREYSIEQILESVTNINYHPILFLDLNNKSYIIDGRTRLYCCIFLNVPAKVRVLKDDFLYKTCINK